MTESRHEHGHHRERQSGSAELVTVFGYILTASYPLLALSTGVRALFQLFFKEGVVNYLAPTLSLAAAFCYLAATIGFAYRVRWAWRLSVGVLAVETALTLVVGTLSLLIPDTIGRTVWRHFGADYGYFPLFQPLIGLVWLFWPSIMRQYGLDGGKTAAPRKRGLASLALRRAYWAQLLRDADDRLRTALHRGIGVALKAVVLLIALGMLLPLAYLFYRAAGVGLTQAIDLLARLRTVQILWNSLLLTCGVTILSLLVALPLAWLTERTDLPGWRIWTVLAMMPLVVPSYVGGFALVAMFGPRGLLQELLSPLGVERLPSIYGLSGALWVLTLSTYPYIFMSIRAALQRFDPTLEEAARSLGYNGLQTYLKATLPNLRPAIAAGGLLVALYTLSDFGAVSLLRYNSFTRAIYIQYLSSFDHNLASLLSLTLIVFTIIFLLLERHTRGRGRPRYYRSGAGVNAPRRRVELAGRKWPALLFCGAVVMAALVLPAGVILFWLLRGLGSGESLVPVWTATFNSLRAGAMAAVAAAALALPVAYAAIRIGGRLMSFTGRAVYVGYALPGIVIALSLVFFGANFAPRIYQTLWMLVFAYVVRFLPQAMGAVQVSLLQMNPRLEEAGRSLGLGRGAVFRRITAPIVRPGVLAAMALVFLTTVKELPATLLLSPTGFPTLATQLWSATEEAFFTRAAAPALMLLAMSALGIFLVLMQEKKELDSG